MSSVTFSTTVGGDGSTVTDDDNATTGLGNGGALIRLVPMMQQVVNVAAHVVSISGGAGDDADAAAASAVAAGSSAIAAAASYDSFDDRYLGSKTSDPSVDNDGNTLLVGALYWNSTSSVMKVWTGSAWVNPNPTAGYLPLTGGTMTGDIVFSNAQNINATALKSATTTIDIDSATAPTAGQVLTAVDSTHAIWEDVPTPPPSAGTITAVASGALANGDVVCLNTDGTVSVIVAPSMGTAVTANSSYSPMGANYNIMSASNGTHLLLCFRGSDGHGYAVLGTVNSSGISFASAVDFAPNGVYTPSPCYDSVNNKFIIVYRAESTGYCTGIVGTVSGDTISFGSPSNLYTVSCYGTVAVFDPTSGRVIVGFTYNTYMWAIALTLSGTSLSMFTDTQYEASTPIAGGSLVSIVPDIASGKILFIWRYSGCYAKAASFNNGSGFNFGTKVDVLSSSYDNSLTAAYNPAIGKTIVFSGYTNGFTYGAILNVSGTVITVNGEINVSNISRNTASSSGLAFTESGLGVLTFTNTSTNYATYLTITCTTTEISVLSSATAFTSDGAYMNYACYVSNFNAIYASYRSYSQYLTVNRFSVPYISMLLGISTASYTNGQTATIGTIGYKADNQTGLTTGRKYYLNTTTGAKQTTTTNAYLGTALSATSLLVKG